MASLASLRARPGQPFDVRHVKKAVVAGAAQDTNIAVSGIQPTDVLLSVLEVQPPTAASGNAVVADRVAAGTVNITSAGNIQTTTTSAGNQLIVEWFDEIL